MAAPRLEEEIVAMRQKGVDGIFSSPYCVALEERR
jgi:hypothetical protein